MAYYNSKMEWAYETMACQLRKEYQMPGVKNAFSEGDYCLEKYGKVYDAHMRLREKLCVPPNRDEPDIEIIIDSMLDIQQEMCYRMYRYGTQFGF